MTDVLPGMTISGPTIALGRCSDKATNVMIYVSLTVLSFTGTNIHTSLVPLCLVEYPILPSHCGPRGWRSPGDSYNGGIHLLSREVGRGVSTCT